MGSCSDIYTSWIKLHQSSRRPVQHNIIYSNKSLSLAARKMARFRFSAATSILSMVAAGLIPIPEIVATDDSPAFIAFEAIDSVLLQQGSEQLRLDHVKSSIFVNDTYQHLVLANGFGCILITAKAINYTLFSKKKAN
jgi:hypothetical protein